MIGWTKGAIVMVVGATAVALARYISRPNSTPQPKSLARIGHQPGGDPSGSPDAAVVPASLPQVPAVQSRALCSHIGRSRR